MYQKMYSPRLTSRKCVIKTFMNCRYMLFYHFLIPVVRGQGHIIARLSIYEVVEGSPFGVELDVSASSCVYDTSGR